MIGTVRAWAPGKSDKYWCSYLSQNRNILQYRRNTTPIPDTFAARCWTISAGGYVDRLRSEGSDGATCDRQAEVVYPLRRLVARRDTELRNGGCRGQQRPSDALQYRMGGSFSSDSEQRQRQRMASRGTGIHLFREPGADLVGARRRIASPSHLCLSLMIACVEQCDI